MKFHSIWFIFFLPCLLLGQAYTLDVLPADFIFPIDITNAGDSRLFVVEQRGRVYILNEDGTKNNTPFLNTVENYESAVNKAY